MQGTVDRLWHNRRADRSEYWVLSIDGTRYATWNRELVRNVQPGDLVEFAYSPSGRHRNLLSLKRLPRSGEEARGGGARNALPVAGDRLTAVRLSKPIVRMNCLRTAATLITDATLLPDQKLSLCMALALRLEDQVLEACRPSHQYEEASVPPVAEPDREAECAPATQPNTPTACERECTATERSDALTSRMDGCAPTDRREAGTQHNAGRARVDQSEAGP